eukprot:2796360-Pleurochrysis_carterae.AAC.1
MRHTRLPGHGKGIPGCGWGSVLQLFFPGVLASAGCAGLAGSSAQNTVAASLVSRVPPALVKERGP